MKAEAGATTATFEFGVNWQRFLSHITQDRVDAAKESLTTFMKLDSLEGKSFLDIGCGSGIFSYAAFQLGAAKVTSFDQDPLAAQCCKYLRAKANTPTNWEIKEGSILDDEFVSNLGTFDIVYAWGVLHHTGDMWAAIGKSAKLVDRGGLCYLAIYNKADGVFGSRFWLRVKEFYNHSPAVGKRLLEWAYVTAIVIGATLKSGSPSKRIQKTSGRGMYWRTDIVDWLGGYPYEFASEKEIKDYFSQVLRDFEQVNVKSTKGLGNNWYLFRRS